MRKWLLLSGSLMKIKLYRVRNLLQCDFVSLICPDLFVLVRRLSFTPPLTLARWSHSLSVLNFCFYTLLPSKSQQCNARMLAEQRSGRMRRDVYSFLDTSFDFVNINWKNITSKMPDLKCERVDPEMKKMLREKFDIAISYSGRFINNILRYFTNSKRIEGVRKSLAFCCCLLDFWVFGISACEFAFLGFGTKICTDNYGWRDCIE